MMLGREPEASQEDVRDARDQGMRGVRVQDEKIMVAESDLRRAGHRALPAVDHGRIGHPCLARVLELVLHAAPLVPGQETIETNEDERDNNEDYDADLERLEDILSDVIDDGHVQAVTKCDLVLLWDGKSGAGELDGGESIVDILSQQLERCPNSSTRDQSVNIIKNSNERDLHLLELLLDVRDSGDRFIETHDAF